MIDRTSSSAVEENTSEVVSRISDPRQPDRLPMTGVRVGAPDDTPANA